MLGLTDYLTEQSWEDILIATYLLVADVLPQACRTVGFRRQHGPEPVYADAQIITIALAAEYWFSGDEEKTLHFLRQYHAMLWSSGIPDSARFNVRRRELFWVLAAARCQFRDAWRQHRQRQVTPETESDERIHLVDSAPVILTSRDRGTTTPTLEPEDRAAWFGVCTSQPVKFLGGRLHATVDLDQMLDEWVLAPGAYPDLKVFPALCEGHTDLIYIGDKAYVSAEQETFVWERGRHLLLPLRRDNQQEQWPAGFQKILGRLRHRVETAISVLTTAFNLRLPHGRSLSGFVARTATKMLAYTLSFWLARQFAV